MLPSLAISHPLLRYYGGKWRLAPWIISHFPSHICYVEPFGGAGSVLLRKTPCQFEIYNDADGEVVNFFRILRDRPRELFRALKYSPFSREEFDQSYEPHADPLEQARRFAIRAWQGYGGPRKQLLTGWKIQKRAWHSGRADQLIEWTNAKHIMAAARRFLQVQIEHDDALKVISRFDTPDTLFYVDPPYPSETRNQRWSKRAYTMELDGQYHIHLANLLNRIQGMAIISTYPNAGYDDLFPGWIHKEKSSQTMNKKLTLEQIYLSPNLVSHLNKASSST